MKFGSPPYPGLALHLAWHFALSVSFSLRSRSAIWRPDSGSKEGFGSAGLVPLMGKALVSNITVPLGLAVAPKALAVVPKALAVVPKALAVVPKALAVAPKALAMALWSVVASPLAILPLPPSRFRPMARYCPISWHLAAKTPPPAVTVLLPSGWHPTATHGLAPYCYSLAGTLLLRLRSVDPSSVTPSRGIALPPWLLSNALDRCNDLPYCTSCFRWALYWSFPMSPIINPLHQAPKGP